MPISIRDADESDVELLSTLNGIVVSSEAAESGRTVFRERPETVLSFARVLCEIDEIAVRVR